MSQNAQSDGILEIAVWEEQGQGQVEGQEKGERECIPESPRMHFWRPLVESAQLLVILEKHVTEEGDVILQLSVRYKKPNRTGEWY